MGLGDIYSFEKEKKVIEYQLDKKNDLTSMRIDDFTDLLSTDAPAPGGGSVASLAGGLSSALSAMVAALTFDKKGYKSFKQEMDEISVKAQQLKEEFIRDVDRDTEAFNKIMAAMKMPKKSDAEKTARNLAITEATKEATLVPFGVLKRSGEASIIARKIAENGNRNSVSDAGVAALCAQTAAEGAYLNVIINLTGIDDKEFYNKIKDEAKKIKEEVVAVCRETIKITEKIIEENK